MKKPHYSWAVCFSCLLLIFCNMGLCNNGFSVCLPFIEADGGFTGTEGSTILSIRCIFSLLSMLTVTRYYRHFSLRRGAFAATVTSAAAYAVYSFGSTHIYIYYLGAAIAGIGYGFGSTIPMSMLINNWFRRRRGLALGIGACGTGVCAMLFPPVMTRLVEGLGLQTAFRVEAAFVLMCAFLVLLIARDLPADMGLRPFGEGEGNDDSHKKSFGSRGLKHWEWAVMLPALVLVGAVSTAGTGHFYIVMTSSGCEAELAASVMSFWGVVLIIGKFLYGAACDHIGCKKATVIFYAFYVAGCIETLTFFKGSPVFYYGFAVLNGLGIPPATVGTPIWAAELSTPEKYAYTLKWNQIAFVLGGVIFTSMPGMLFDRLGNYQSAYLVLAVFTLVSTCAICFLYDRRKHEKHS